MTHTQSFLKSILHSDPGYSEAMYKLPVGKPSQETNSCPTQSKSGGTTSTKPAMGTSLGVNFALAYLLHCLLDLTCQAYLHPSTASLSLNWFPNYNLKLPSLFLWLTFIWLFQSSKYLPATKRPWREAVQLSGKSHSPLPLISSWPRPWRPEYLALRLYGQVVKEPMVSENIIIISSLNARVF